tara:strand:+ start:2512 stop:2784 length:273 start_codon:yes stop_codon:yes gene_type:complete
LFGAIKDPMKIWYLYVVRCSDSTLYTGVTTDLKRRLNEHNTSNRGAKYTKARRPINLVYYELYQSRSNAQKAEHKFKKLTREQKERRIST